MADRIGVDTFGSRHVFPLARLFELGGKTIWAPAIVQFVVQGLVKVVVVSVESAGSFPVFWMIVCAVVPICGFLSRSKSCSAIFVIVS
jgi:hypothetical protein